jgi:hypothetical protein
MGSKANKGPERTRCQCAHITTIRATNIDSATIGTTTIDTVAIGTTTIDTVAIGTTTPPPRHTHTMSLPVELRL